MKDKTNAPDEVLNLVNEDVLIQQRSRKKKVNAGMWSVSCAGHVPKETSPMDAAHMELKEELGFDTELAFVDKHLDKKPTETRIVYWYEGKYEGNDIVIEPEEVEGIRWVPKDGFHEFVGRNIMTNIAKVRISRFWKEKRR